MPWIAGLEPSVHGAAAGRSADILDFSANGNVIGPPPGVAKALQQVDLARYPDRQAVEVRETIAAREGVPVTGVVVGNGSTELIWAVARAYLAPGRRAAVIGPTYGEYAVASQAAGAAFGGADSQLGNTTSYLASSFSQRVERPHPKPLPAVKGVEVVWICHPNNPTGEAFPVELLPDLIAVAPRCLFVVDEAYLTLTEGLASATDQIEGGHVVVVRSLTKDLGLAGVRIGYLLTAPEVADVIRRALPAWNVSALAQAAAVAALADRGHLERARAAVAESRAHLVAGLERIGLRSYPSVANFVLVQVPEASAGDMVARLLERGMAVRDCTSFGLAGCIRIGVRSIPDQERLLEALAAMCAARPAGAARG